MKLNRTPMVATVIVAAFLSSSVMAQSNQQDDQRGSMKPARPAAPSVGPHGGTLRHVSGMQLETIVTQGGIQLYVRDTAERSVTVTKTRGVVSLHIPGNAKKYRYELLPDGKGRLTAPVNLAKIAGRQIELDVQLVGLAVAKGRVAFETVTSVPPSAEQLTAAAIARQKTCPVSKKPLGSMGQPVAIDNDGQRVFVCCSGCVGAFKADPAKYAMTRLRISVSSATSADADLVKRQATCPVLDEPLGSMGQPIKVMVGDKPVFLCCKGCVKKVETEPAKYLAMVYDTPTQ